MTGGAGALQIVKPLCESNLGIEMEFQLQLQLKMEMEKVQRVGGVAIYCEILKLHKLRAARAWPVRK